MTKDFGVKPYLFPMPTYMIGSYNEDGSVDVMMMAWGGICAEDMVALNLESEHKTVANLKKEKRLLLQYRERIPSKSLISLVLPQPIKLQISLNVPGFMQLKAQGWTHLSSQSIRLPWNVKWWKCNRSPMDCGCWAGLSM